MPVAFVVCAEGDTESGRRLEVGEASVLDFYFSSLFWDWLKLFVFLKPVVLWLTFKRGCERSCFSHLVVQRD